MKKHIKTILGIIFALLLCGTVFAQTKSNPESDFKLIIPELEFGDPYYVYIGKSENVVIPKKEFYSDRLFRTAHTTVKVKSVVIPEGVTSIGYSAFAKCSSIENISIPSTVTSIGAQAFYECSSLKTITIPKSVTSIGKYAFQGCSSLKEISLPQSVKSIGADAFAYSGISRLTISRDEQMEMGKKLFSSAHNLKNVIISEGVTTIPIGAFKGCSALTSVSIPSTVTSIDASAFYECSSLTEISIPPSVTYIGKSAFAGTGIEKIIIPSDFDNNFELFSDTYVYHNNSLKNVIFLEGVTNIGAKENDDSDYYFYSDYGAFQNCEGLTSITIPATVTRIGIGAFRGCTNLANVTIPEGVTTIDVYAFEDCTALTSITIPATVTRIGIGAFKGCTNLANVTIKEGVTTIDGEAFKGCSALTSVTIPEGVSIHSYAFDDGVRINVVKN